MIYVINHHSEFDPKIPTFRYYREVIGRENIKIHCASEQEDFSFLTKDDIVLLRSGDRRMVETLIARQKEVGFRSTIESISTIETAYDKEKAKALFQENGILVPRSFRIDEVSDDESYFVKPIQGEDHRGITLNSVCKNKEEVIKQCQNITQMGYVPIIEQFISGLDCTVTVISDPDGDIATYAIDVEVENEHQIQTEDVKRGTIVYCSPTSAPIVNEIAKAAFEAIGAKHYARIDFRISESGVPYLLDFNIFPGFGMDGYMYRSLLLTVNKSYKNFIEEVLESAK